MKKLLGSVIVLLLLCLIFPVSAEATTEYVGYDEAVLQLRQQLVQRETTAVVYLQTNHEIGSLELWDMLEDAMAHTGNPKEGDYIRANMVGCDYSVETRADNGTYYHTCSFIPNWISTRQQETEVDAAVDALLAELDLWNATNYEQVKGVYDWITENVAYDYDWDDMPEDRNYYQHSTHAALIEKNAVCQGFASLYYRLLLELGVDCRYISGISTDITGTERHAWNIVYLDGKYYNCDATWDRSLMGHYRHFLCTEENFGGHTRDAQYDTADFHAKYPMWLTPYVLNVTASGTVNSNIAWVLDGSTGTLTVAGTGPIPSYRYSYAPWYNYRESVKKIVVGEGITEVGERAFYWCTNCTSLELPSTLTAIREYGFNNLRALQYVTLPQNLRILEFCAFSECVALKEIILPDSVTTVESNAFSNCTALTKAVLSAGMTSVPSSMFGGDTKLWDVTIPEGITYIDDTAFINTGLLEFTLPSTVTGLGVSVFSGCTGLQNFYVEAGNPSYKAVNGVLFTADGKHLICYPSGKSGSYTVPEGTEYIDYGAFRSVKYLYYVYFPTTLKEIDGYAFSYCKYLYRVTFPSNITRIGDSAFRSCISLYSVTFENQSVVLEPSVFADCDGLYSITLPKYLKEIPSGLFYGSGNLGSITIPSTVSKIGSSAFLDCDSLISVTIPGNVKSIGQQAFDFCNKLETIVFEEGVQTLGWICMRNNPRLKKVVIPSSVTKIEQPTNTDSYLFDECPKVVLYVNCGTYGHNYAVNRGLSYNLSHPQSTRVVPPTCTEDGYTVYGCVCGLYGTKSDFVAATGHDYVSYTVEPDCYSYGYTYHSCQNCWDYYETDYVEPRHSFGDWYVIYEAACEYGGGKERYCSWCGHWEYEDIPPTGHAYKSTYTEPTCTEAGFVTHVCTTCGHTYTDGHVDALWHTYDNGLCSDCGCDMVRVTIDDIIRYQGGVSAEDGTLNTTFTNNWYANIHIPVGAEQVRFLTFKTGANWGSAFFGEVGFLSGFCDSSVGGQWVTLDIPDEATQFRYGYLYDQIAQNNGWELFRYVEFAGQAMEDWEPSPYMERPATGCHSFSVDVNIAPAMGDPDGSVIGTDYGYILLPTSYSAYGEPTRLIIVCHGAGASLGTYQSDAWKKNNYSFWTDLGYAVMDMYACPRELSGSDSCLHYGNPVVLDCYKAGYDYVMEHFNLKRDGIYVIGSSMGGLSSFQIVQSELFPVLAQVAYCPVIDLYKQAYCNPWTTASYQRSRIASYFGFSGPMPKFTDTKFPSAEEIEFYKQNFDKTIPYSPILQNVVCGDMTAIFQVAPTSATATDAAEAALYAQLTATHPCPLMIFHNTNDATVSYRYSQYFVDMVNRSGQEAILYTFTSGGHNAWANGSDVTLEGINGQISIKESQYQAYLFFNQLETHETHYAWVDPAVEASCTQSGLSEGSHCASCGEILKEQDVVESKGHTYISTVTLPTCTAQGYTTHTCDACGDSYVDSYTDPAGHTPGEPVVENAGVHGSHDSVVYCRVCGEELSREYCDGYLPGDINGDGAVNNKDVTRLFQYLSDYDVEVVEEALDVNGDGSVNNKDLTRLFQYLSDYDVEIY